MASERGIAQTAVLLCSGVVGPDVELQNCLLAKLYWKGRPQKVTVLYVKADRL